jgi:hypothetical protein
MLSCLFCSNRTLHPTLIRIATDAANSARFRKRVCSPSWLDVLTTLCLTMDPSDSFRNDLLRKASNKLYKTWRDWMYREYDVSCMPPKRLFPCWRICLVQYVVVRRPLYRYISSNVKAIVVHSQLNVTLKKHGTVCFVPCLYLTHGHRVQSCRTWDFIFVT